MNERILSLLGMARRAGRLSLGHDAVISSVIKNKAKLCVVSSDASDRLKKELAHACSYNGKNIPLTELDESMLSVSNAVGCKCAVLSVDDEGFAKKIFSMVTENEKVTSNKSDMAEGKE